jgi:hypothetical protein
MPGSHFCCVAAVMAVVLLSAFGDVEGAVINARSASLADVNSAVASASDGDTVAVPAGSASWTSTLSVTKGITLQGAGSDTTVILDDVPREAPQSQQQQKDGARAGRGGGGKFAGGPPSRGEGVLRTGQNRDIVTPTLKASQSFRMTGFTFRAGSVASNGDNGIRVLGTCSSFRIDHCHFDKLYRADPIKIAGQIYGVIDHCTFDCRPKTQSILVWHNEWGGKSYGDGSWADSPYFGSEKFIFIEDNTFVNFGLFTTNGDIDCYGGGRYVCRHNTFYNCKPNSHGTESSGRLRSSRAVEIYDNTINFTIAGNAGQIRGGTALIHDNTYIGAFSRGMTLHVYREFYPFHVFGGASGNNRWDSNDPHGLYAQGKHTGANASQTLVVANADWKTDQWVGYTVTNTTQTLRNGEHYCSFIKSNTGDTITYELDNSFGPYMSFNTGEAFAIYKVLISLDQPGRGKGDLISGNPPGPVGWPHQALEPIYSWNNKLNGSNVNISGGLHPTLQENRDYYNDKEMPGYKPYAYPHPLVSGGPLRH